MIDSISKMDCTGCKMCKDICPVDAIFYETDNEGFWYPKVNIEKCIKCGKCIKKCPSLSENSNPKAGFPDVYAAWALSDEIRLKSTSGGIFYVLAQHMIDNGGSIAACKYSSDFKSAYHVLGNSKIDLEEFKGSKYFQSNTEGIYKSAEEQIKAGTKILFCGAPCQVAGLNKFIGTESPNLITVDFICRGINSPMVFKKYVEDCEKHFKSPVKKVHLKNKNRGWTRLGTYMEFKNNKTYYRDRITDPWVNGFVRGNLFMRPCCSICKYKEEMRIADISIGDFWGYKSTPDNLYKGISLILANTDKGKKYIESVKGQLYLEPHTYEDALKGNKCLRISAPLGIHRKEFFEQLPNMKFEELVWKLLGEKKMNLFLQEMKYNLKESIKKIIGR